MRKKHFRAKTNDGKTCIRGSEKNYVRSRLYYTLNEEVQRKDIVEIRKIIDSNDSSRKVSIISATKAGTRPAYMPNGYTSTAICSLTVLLLFNHSAETIASATN
jgi:hypothetical protein